jgi:hypothetical protein
MTRISPAESEFARDVLLEIGSWEIDPDFAPYVTFASGKEANNKISVDTALHDHPEWVRNAICDPMETLVRASDSPIDTLWGVPSGGQEYAVELAHRLGVEVVRLIKVENQPGIKTYRPASDDDIEKLKAARHMAAIEDAGSEWTSLWGAMHNSPELSKLELHARTNQVVVGWQRGLWSEVRNLHVSQVQAVVSEHVPNIITPGHPFFVRFGHLAILRQEPQ